MWISARTATTLAAAALLLVMVAVAAPLLPRPRLPSLPEERVAKFGAAQAALEAPERVRAQRMAAEAPAPKGAAQWADRVGVGTAESPSPETVRRLASLLRDGRTVAGVVPTDVRPSWVVRFVRDDHRVDVMVDAGHDRLVVVRDGTPVGGYAVSSLHREFAALGGTLFP